MPTLAVTDVKRRGADEQLMKRRDCGCAISLMCWAIWNLTDLTCSTLTRTSCERSLMQREKLWLQRDALCGTLCANRIWYGRSLLECHHSSSTHSLTEIGPRTKRNGGQAGKLCSRNDSSGGAEMHACISGKQRVVANCNLLAEIGCLVPRRVHTDSNVARGMMTRRGSGYVKHLKLNALCVTERSSKGASHWSQCTTNRNPADIGTKTPRADRTVHLLRLLGMDSV